MKIIILKLCYKCTPNIGKWTLLHMDNYNDIIHYHIKKNYLSISFQTCYGDSICDQLKKGNLYLKNLVKKLNPKKVMDFCVTLFFQKFVV